MAGSTWLGSDQAKQMKPLGWIGTAKDDLLAFPEEVIRDVSYALCVAQLGGRRGSAKSLKGFGGAGILEIVEVHASGAYRAVYTDASPH